MSAIFCGLKGAIAKEDMSEGDRAIVAQFQLFLRRQKRAMKLDDLFDGDTHILTPDIADRSEFIIVDGKVDISR